MTPKLPNGCNNEGSIWSATYGQGIRLMEWHNLNASGMTTDEAIAWRVASGFNTKHSATHKMIGDAYSTMLSIDFFNAKVPDHVHDGEVFYPPGFNTDNEGSIMSLSRVLMHNLDTSDSLNPDVIVVGDLMQQAKLDAGNQKHWSMDIEDYNG